MCGRQLIRFCKDYAKRHTILAQHLYKAQINSLWLQTRIHQHKEEVHLLALEHIVHKDLGKLATLILRHTGVALAGQIDQIPITIDAEVVDKTCLAGCCRDLGQALATREHINERRLTHITTTDKGHIAQIVLGDLRNLL